MQMNNVTEKLDRIRKISNIIQALENVLVQCEGMEEVDVLDIVVEASTNLSIMKERLKGEIHSSEELE